LVRPAPAICFAAGLILASCASQPARDEAGGVTVRRVAARVLVPPPINLYDRDMETLGVVAFEGPSGQALAEDLAARLDETRAYRVVGPGGMAERLLRAGVSVAWDASASSLRWAGERAGVDAVVVGRVQEFHAEGWDDEKETLTLRGTGEYRFEVNDEGKLAYREKKAYQRVPLFCRTDRGTVAAAYRVLDLRRGAVVATVEHDISTELPSFCYREDVPARLINQARDRLLRRLFQRLNQGFLEDVVPRAERSELAFEVVAGVLDGGLVHRNELGILSASRGEWQQALDVWRDCLLDFPDAAPVHYNLAVVYRAMGRITRAEEHFAKAAALAPRSLYLESLREVRTGTVPAAH